jgi:hypothetical protein
MAYQEHTNIQIRIEFNSYYSTLALMFFEGARVLCITIFALVPARFDHRTPRTQWWFPKTFGVPPNHPFGVYNRVYT